VEWKGSQIQSSQAAATQVLVEDTGELVQTQIIRMTSKSVAPETGTPTIVWIVLDSTPWPSSVATATPDGQPEATEEQTTADLESVRESPATGRASAKASPAASPEEGVEGTAEETTVGAGAGEGVASWWEFEREGVAWSHF
jgi:hypothetical protein